MRMRIPSSLKCELSPAPLATKGPGLTFAPLAIQSLLNNRIILIFINTVVLLRIIVL